MKQQIQTDLTARIDEIGKELIEKAKTYEFHTSHLPELNNYNTDIRKSPQFIELFNELNLKTHNCLYWFSLKNESIAEQINNRLNENRDKLKYESRVVPPENKNKNSKTLYVGIRRGGVRKKDSLSNISGRIIQHLGYYEKGSTQGLQLIHWAKGSKNVMFFLNIVELLNFPNEYLNAIEAIVAYKLKPLCGKH